MQPFTEYDKAIAAFVSSALTLAAAFNAPLPEGITPGAIAAMAPFISMVAVFAVRNLEPAGLQATKITRLQAGALFSDFSPQQLEEASRAARALGLEPRVTKIAGEGAVERVSGYWDHARQEPLDGSSPPPEVVEGRAQMARSFARDPEALS